MKLRENSKYALITPTSIGYALLRLTDSLFIAVIYLKCTLQVLKPT